MKQFRFNQFCILILIMCCSLFATSCSAKTGRIRLCDYKHIRIPEDVLTISKEDLDAAIAVDMFAYNVLIPKSSSSVAVVEYGDVVTISALIDNNESKYDVIVGAQMFGTEFDESISGKSVGDQFDFHIGGKTGRAVILSVSTFADSISDEIARRYYHCNSATEAIQLIEQEIAKSKIFDFVYPKIINNSMVSGYYEERSEYVNRVTSLMLQEASDEGYDVEDTSSVSSYLDGELGTSLADYQYSLESFYDEYLILCELMEQEGATISDEELSLYYESNETDISDNSFGPMGKEYAIYSLYYEHCPEILMKYYQ